MQYLKKYRVAVVGAGSALTVNAHAVVPAEVVTSLAAIAADMVEVGTLMVLAAAAAIGLKWIKGAIFS